jgi:alkanesulfonate monooxygenase SsuD/methylene tetrahydromethanopterin reductase-like flavin-dependent oxidoreductase (luciferase family)
MRFALFHLMPYGALDLSYTEKYPSAWTSLPNSYYDPKKGSAYYNRYLDELEYGEEIGFETLCVNEHHQTAYGLMAMPGVIAGALSRRTTKAKIAVLGRALPLINNPLMVAEEYAILDNITAGRLVAGFVRGVGIEYHTTGVNPGFSHERFHEAHDLIVQAWTKTGPFAFEGKHYHFEYVNVWPRPFQQPHPPIWCPSMGSTETIDWAAHPDRKYVYLQNFSPRDSVARYLNMYREVAERKYGYTASSDRIGWCAPIYVADTDEQAISEARPHIEALFNIFLPKISESMFLPPGYMSIESLKAVRQHKRGHHGGAKVEAMNDAGIIIVGSPDTVRKRIAEAHRMMGFQEFIAMLQFGTMPAHLAEKNIRLFASQVMPAIKTLTDREYRGFEMRAAAE